MSDRSEINRMIAVNRYLVLGTADVHGKPWVSPVFFAPCRDEAFYWVSSPDARHSRNIARRPSVAITMFDSTAPIGGAEGAYFDGDAHPAPRAEVEDALSALNARLPASKQLEDADLAPHGLLVLYRADVRQRYLLVRGGNKELGNPLDMTVEVSA